MIAVRQLPIRIAPIPGEALDSWLEALAGRTHTAWADLVTAITNRPRGAHTNRWVVQLDPQDAETISQATRVGVDELTAMTLTRFDGRGVRIDSAVGEVSLEYPWSRGRGSRYCPQCLSDTGGR